MRKSLLFLLLASAAAPALAAPDDDGGDRAARREAARAERSEARTEHQAERTEVRSDRQVERADRPQVQRLERPAEVHAVQPGGGHAVASEQRRGPPLRRALEGRAERNLGAESAHPTLEHRGTSEDSVAEWRARERRVGASPAAIEQHGGSSDRVREWRARERRVETAPAVVERRDTEAGSLQERRRDRTGRDSIGNHRVPVISRTPREGTQPPPRVNSHRSRPSTHHWRGTWRSDHRYDWQNHRRRHRSHFHLGFYYDPFGWGYRPYSIGWRMWPSYYRSSYWLNDPWSYRLPYAPAGYRWIRYYDDAVLVDTWDGQVVDVIRNFFW